jgi:hypothetical protein
MSFSVKNLFKFRGGVREAGVAVWNQGLQRFNSPSPYVVSLLAPFTLMTLITERLKVGFAKRRPAVLDSQDVVDHLGRAKTAHAYGIPSDKPAAQSLPLSRGVEASVLILSLVEGSFASRVKVAAASCYQSRASWESTWL